MPRTHSFHEGFLAFESGIPSNKNHYPVDSKEFKQWNEGYRSAHDEFIYDDLIGDNDYEQACEILLSIYRPFDGG
jgi:hypothetical protein